MFPNRRPTAIASLLGLVVISAPVRANPISTPFDYTPDLVLVNFPFNGAMLLVFWLLVSIHDNRGLPMGCERFYLHFLASVTIITSSGALIDSAAFWVDRPSVNLVALLLIGSIGMTVSRVNLLMTMRESLCTGIAFGAYNAVFWALGTDTYYDVLFFSWDYHWGFVIVCLLYILVLALVLLRRDKWWKGHHVTLPVRHAEPRTVLARIHRVLGPNLITMQACVSAVSLLYIALVAWTLYFPD